MRRVIVWVVALACISGVAWADEPKETERPDVPLEFKTGYDLPNGKVAIYKGVASAAPGDHYFTETTSRWKGPPAKTAR